ncbi:hypothetical protein [Paraburkholderia sp. J8-2]|uniref:hypothetical protein n=1 Tax=Paraburkholderia sp. J8-2 TaxID=2805440 RepID=UPI002AB74B27|nr:hypothetical protein [Paraburkholderia sp. J8-2]
MDVPDGPSILVGHNDGGAVVIADLERFMTERAGSNTVAACGRDTVRGSKYFPPMSHTAQAISSCHGNPTERR